MVVMVISGCTATEKVDEAKPEVNQENIVEPMVEATTNQQATTNEAMNVGVGQKEMKEKVDAVDVSMAGIYIDYSEAVFLEHEDKRRVLFFHASWCPTCKTANKNFISQREEIPQNIVLLKLNYDKETDLKKKYGITYQHTFVLVDKEGNSISKWNGGDIAKLKERTQ
jgi:thiol-disulfide isomerase/thioredoxin